jgi:Uri superfamily endonuclease
VVEVPIIGGFRKLYNERIFYRHSSPNVITVIVMEDEMGRKLSTHRREEECIQGFGGKDRRKETTRKT